MGPDDRHRTTTDPRSRFGGDHAVDRRAANERRHAVVLSRVARAGAVVAAAIGGTYLLAWLGGAAARWSAAGAITMKTNMAVSLLLAGVALFLVEPTAPSHARRTAGSILGALVLVVGALTLLEHVFRWNLGIDQLIASEAPGAVATASPNRVGLPGCASLALVGAGLILAARRRPLAAYFGLATCVVVVVPAIGFLYGLSPLYAERTTGIAWPTVVALLALGLGLVLCVRDRSPFAILWRDDPGGELVRRLLVPSILIPLALGYVRVQGERYGLYRGPTGTALYSVTLTLLFSTLLWLTARRLSEFAMLRRHAVGQLAAEKDRLAVTLRSIGDAVIATDESGRVTVMNVVAEALTGWKAEEALGLPLHEVFHIVNEETRQPVESPVDRVLREGVVVGLANHTALVARDLSERPIADSGAPIRSSDGHVAGVVLVFRDQTAERRATEELGRARARAEWLASFPARNPVPIAEIDVEGRVRYTNAAAERLLPEMRATGTDHPWLAGWGDVVRIFREGAASHERTVAVGESSYHQMMYFVPETQCIRIYGIDATERARAEAALRDSERRLRALADSMPQLAWTARPDGYITWYNRRWYEYTGTTPEQMEGWGWQAVHDPATLPEVLRRWKESIASGAPFEMDFPLRRADGELRRFLTRGFPLKDEHGEVIQWFGTNTDVTELVEARDALRQAARRKDEFLGMLSHELRNPLAPIRNAVFILERAGAAGEHAARARDVIKRQTEHLARIVDDLLDVTRIEHGKIQLDLSRVDLGELASQAADDFRHVMSERHVDFRTVLPDAEIWVDADATRITQLLGNLLHNAVKFTRAGDVVTLSLRAKGAHAELSVTDTGVGIDPALLAHVFEPFVQGDRTLARTEGGLGLGLAVVKAVAELHGGAVRAESVGSGRGATFEVRVPLAARPATHRAAPPRAGSTDRSRRVLVVDDNRDAADSMAAILTMLGHDAEVAYDGPDAIDKVRADTFDAVLCDIGLPGMTGYEVARTLRATRRDGLKLIAVSGYAQPEDVQRAIEAGFDGHIAKPCSPSDVERLLA
jgi:PAS domain S-box-containing protein